MIKKFSEYVNEWASSGNNLHYDERFAVDQDEYGYRELYLYFDDNYEYTEYNKQQLKDRREMNFVHLLTVKEDEFDGISIRVTKTIKDLLLMNVDSEKVLLIPDYQIDSRRVLKKINEIAKYEETTLKTSEGDIDVVKFTPKDGIEVTDEFFVEFVDFILNNTDEPFIKENKYHQSWFDYHKDIDVRQEELRKIRKRNGGRL